MKRIFTAIHWRWNCSLELCPLECREPDLSYFSPYFCSIRPLPQHKVDSKHLRVDSSGEWWGEISVLFSSLAFMFFLCSRACYWSIIQWYFWNVVNDHVHEVKACSEQFFANRANLRFWNIDNRSTITYLRKKCSEICLQCFQLYSATSSGVI